MPLLVIIAVALNAFLFFHPLNKTAKAASYETVVSWDNYMQQVVETVQALRGSGRLAVVVPGFVSGWRTVSYYYPDVPVLVIESGSPENPGGARWQYNHRLPLPVRDGRVELPSCGAVLWLDPTSRPGVEGSNTTVLAIVGTPVTYTTVRPALLFRFRNYRFETAAAPDCL